MVFRGKERVAVGWSMAERWCSIAERVNLGGSF